MIGDDRQFTTSFGYTIVFNNISTIIISKDDPKEGEHVEVQLDPTDLSVIYGAYMQMKKEEFEKEKVQST
jgi:hypothetical protein